MLYLNEKIYGYLKEQDKAMSIGEINSSKEFADVSRRTLAQELQQMERQNDLYRSLRNGKAYYSISGENAVQQNRVRDGLKALEEELKKEALRIEAEKREREEQLYKKVKLYCDQKKSTVGEYVREWEYKLDGYRAGLSSKTVMTVDALLDEIRDLIYKRNTYGRKFDELILCIDKDGKNFINQGSDYKGVKSISELLDYIKEEVTCMNLDIHTTGTHVGYLGNMDFELNYSSIESINWWRKQYKQMPGYAKALRVKRIEDTINCYEKEISTCIRLREKYDINEKGILQSINELEKQVLNNEQEYEKNVQSIQCKIKEELERQQKLISEKREEIENAERKVDELQKNISQLSFFKISQKKQLSSEVEILKNSIPDKMAEIKSLENEYELIKSKEKKEIDELRESIGKLKKTIASKKNEYSSNTREKERNEAKISENQEAIEKAKSDLENIDAIMSREIQMREKRKAEVLGHNGTKTGRENSILKEMVIQALCEFEHPITISEFMKESAHEVATLSNQKLSALFKELEEGGLLIKTIEKKKSYFILEDWMRESML